MMQKLTEVRKRLQDILADRYSTFRWVPTNDAQNFDAHELWATWVYPFREDRSPKFNWGSKLSDGGPGYYWIDVEMVYR